MKPKIKLTPAQRTERTIGQLDFKYACKYILHYIELQESSNKKKTDQLDFNNVTAKPSNKIQ